MATPYLQQRHDTVPSTQDTAKAGLETLPLLVMAKGQTSGRGRSGSEWLTAEAAVAASLALHVEASDKRPFPLIAGVAAIRALPVADLKWPNDLLVAEDKVGGILVERSGTTVVIGLGLNLYWDDPPSGVCGLYRSHPGENRPFEIGALWGAELMSLLDEDDWPRAEYIVHCVTLGQRVTWDPDGEGTALGIDADGGLIVDSGESETVLHSGGIRHLRHS